MGLFASAGRDGSGGWKEFVTIDKTACIPYHSDTVVLVVFGVW